MSTQSLLEAGGRATRQRTFGLDCEMVGVGPKAEISMLARVTLVEYSRALDELDETDSPLRRLLRGSFVPGDFTVVYDRIVIPTVKVKDFRTKYSGITREILNCGLPGAPLVSFSVCRREVAQLLAGSVVVGHALSNDFNALKMKHPNTLKRDTAFYGPFMNAQVTKSGQRMRPKKLRYVFHDEFGYSIQGAASGHSSAEDASASLALYIKHRKAWEGQIVESGGGEEGGRLGGGHGANCSFTLVLDGEWRKKERKEENGQSS